MRDCLQNERNGSGQMIFFKTTYVFKTSSPILLLFLNPIIQLKWPPNLYLVSPIFSPIFGYLPTSIDSMQSLHFSIPPHPLPLILVDCISLAVCVCGLFDTACTRCSLLS